MEPKIAPWGPRCDLYLVTMLPYIYGSVTKNKDRTRDALRSASRKYIADQWLNAQYNDTTRVIQISMGEQGDQGQHYYPVEGYNHGYNPNAQYIMQGHGQYHQAPHSTTTTSASNLFTNVPSNSASIRKPSPIRRTQSFEVDESEIKFVKRRSQTQSQFNPTNLPRGQSRGSKSNSNTPPPQRTQQSPSSPDSRSRSLSSRGSSPSRSVSPSRRALVNVIPHPDLNICNAICATLKNTNKTPEILASEMGSDSALLPEINSFLSGAARPEGWDLLEKQLINWMVLQNTSGPGSYSQSSTSVASNPEPAIITSQKQNPVTAASPGKSDHWIVDSDDTNTPKYHLGNPHPQISPNLYYSPNAPNNWHPNPVNYHNREHPQSTYLSQAAPREPIQSQSPANYHRSPEKHPAQQIPSQKQHYQQPIVSEDPRIKALAAWPQQNRSAPNPQESIYSNAGPRAHHGPTDNQYVPLQKSNYAANNMYNPPQAHVPNMAPHLQNHQNQQQMYQSYQNINIAPHLRSNANFEQQGNYVSEPMAQLRLDENTGAPNNRQPNQYYHTYDGNVHYNNSGSYPSQDYN